MRGILSCWTARFKRVSSGLFSGDMLGCRAWKVLVLVPQRRGCLAIATVEMEYPDYLRVVDKGGGGG